jgi:hypothetical protein
MGSTFDQLLERWPWRAIPNCPGRFTLSGRITGLTPDGVAGAALQSFEFRVQSARDAVVVTPLGDGSGLISYRRADGSYVHTLNTGEGLERKLRDLAIELPADSN